MPPARTYYSFIFSKAGASLVQEFYILPLTVWNNTAHDPIKALPKTFRDAVPVLQQLNVQYLWIDSLCIIQDSDEDWRTEAARMPEVYRNAICNFAASHGANSKSGLLTDRTALNLHPCHINLNCSGQSRSHHSFQSHWNAEVSKAPVNRRAWVLQESAV